MNAAAAWQRRCRRGGTLPCRPRLRAATRPPALLSPRKRRPLPTLAATSSRRCSGRACASTHRPRSRSRPSPGRRPSRRRRARSRARAPPPRRRRRETHQVREKRSRVRRSGRRRRARYRSRPRARRPRGSPHRSWRTHRSQTRARKHTALTASPLRRRRSRRRRRRRSSLVRRRRSRRRRRNAVARDALRARLARRRRETSEAITRGPYRAHFRFQYDQYREHRSDERRNRGSRESRRATRIGRRSRCSGTRRRDAAGARAHFPARARRGAGARRGAPPPCARRTSASARRRPVSRLPRAALRRGGPPRRCAAGGEASDASRRSKLNSPRAPSRRRRQRGGGRGVQLARGDRRLAPREGPSFLGRRVGVDRARLTESRGDVRGVASDASPSTSASSPIPEPATFSRPGSSGPEARRPREAARAAASRRSARPVTAAKRRAVSPGSRVVAAAEALARRYHESPLWDVAESLEAEKPARRGGRVRRHRRRRGTRAADRDAAKRTPSPFRRPRERPAGRSRRRRGRPRRRRGLVAARAPYAPRDARLPRLADVLADVLADALGVVLGVERRVRRGLARRRRPVFLHGGESRDGRDGRRFPSRSPRGDVPRERTWASSPAPGVGRGGERKGKGKRTRAGRRDAAPSPREYRARRAARVRVPRHVSRNDRGSFEE